MSKAIETPKSRVDAIVRRCERATKGPWRSKRNPQRPYRHVQFDRDDLYDTSPLKAADADFIAHAREDIPYLLSLVDALWATAYGSAPSTVGRAR